MKTYVLPATVALGPYPPPNTFPTDEVNAGSPSEPISLMGITFPPRIMTSTLPLFFAAVILGSRRFSESIGAVEALSIVTDVPPTIE